MPVTFAEAGADDVTFGVTTLAFNNNRAGMVSGWFRKTGAGDNTLWSFGTAGNRLDWTATGELRLTTDRVTTDGVYITSGLALAADTWYFICLFFNTTTANEGTRLWVGTVESAPVSVSIPVSTSPSGNATGSNTFYIGNFGTSATDSFGGDIAHVFVLVTDQGTLGHASFGTTTAAEDEWIYQTKVLPLWRGRISELLHQGWGNTTASLNMSAWFVPLDIVMSATVIYYGFVRQSTNWQINNATANGVTTSQNGPPRPVYGPPFGQPILRRR